VNYTGGDRVKGGQPSLKGQQRRCSLFHVPVEASESGCDGFQLESEADKQSNPSVLFRLINGRILVGLARNEASSRVQVHRSKPRERLLFDPFVPRFRPALVVDEEFVVFHVLDFSFVPF